MSLDSYGGNPDIIASRDEMFRIASQLQLAAGELIAFDSIESFLDDPVKQLRFRIAAQSIYSKLEQLQNRCVMAAEGYFTTEAQIHRRFEFAFVPELARVVQFFATTAGWKLNQGVSALLTQTGTVRPPESVAFVLERLRQLSLLDEPTVGVDLFDSESGKVAIVYIPGTQSFEFGRESNPLDMASNIQAMGNPSQAASERSVLSAMRQAGVDSNHEVIFVGHSQGGMVAANLASYPTGYLAAGLIAFGAPLAHLKISRTPVLAIEHTNDPVPQLSGKANPLRRNWVTVQRKSLKGESEDLIHSHSLDSYGKTAREVDKSESGGVKKIRSQILGLLNSSRFGKSNNFVIQRITEF